MSDRGKASVRPDDGWWIDRYTEDNWLDHWLLEFDNKPGGPHALIFDSDLAKEIVRLLNNPSPWRSVEHAMPLVDSYVLVDLKYGRREVLRWTGEVWEDWDAETEYREGEVRWWMPIPPVPEEV